MRTRLPKGDPVVVPFEIAIDTRESAPWSFEGLHSDADKGNAPLLIQVQRKTLQTGDYSIVGLEHEITIERKSLQDLYSTLAAGRDRFKREHERMMSMVRCGGYACVIIESPLHTAMLAPPMTSSLNPKTVFRTFVRWSQRYDVPWYFVESRSLAEVLAFRFLEAWHKHKEEVAL